MSSSILKASYNESEQELTITFASGKTYVYENVPVSEWEGLQQAESKGKYVNTEIKPYYYAEQVGRTRV